MSNAILKLENLDIRFYISFYTLVFIIGICIGSFMNVLIYRLPRNENIITSSSRCTSCGSKIKYLDMIPIFSWIFLRGKCRQCGVKISARYPLIEIMNSIIYIITFTVMDFSAMSILVCIFFSILTVIGFTDWDTLEIDIRLLAAIGIIAVISIFTDNSLTLFQRMTGGIIISAPFFIIGEISSCIIESNTGEKIRGIELGDTILMAVSGLFIGYKAAVVSAFIGIILASIAGLIIKHKSGESKLAFGPFLSIGLFFGTLWGNSLTDWWFSLFI